MLIFIIEGISEIYRLYLEPATTWIITDNYAAILTMYIYWVQIMVMLMSDEQNYYHSD